MAIEVWKPASNTTKLEDRILKRLARVRKFFGFLRKHRLELIDDAFQSELMALYRDNGQGKDALAPGMMAMATLIQGYLGASDALMVELTLFDLTVQMVLGTLGAQEPAFSQGAFCDFRSRFMKADMDRRLLERTVEIARKTGEFDHKKLPKTLRVAFDSKPLEGAGRVEDTYNLLGHAARKIVICVSEILDWSVDKVCEKAGVPILLESSIKAGLDIDWSDPIQKQGAINTLVNQLNSLQAWLGEKLPMELRRPPLKEHIETLERIKNQDLEPDPHGGGVKIMKGVAKDRLVSVEDKEMRHGRKSKSKRFNGYKQHIATDIDSDVILACTVTPANRPEKEAAPALKADIDRQKFSIGEFFTDRGYINSPVVNQVDEVFCKPWASASKRQFAKSQFAIDMRSHTITCPAGETATFEIDSIVEFDPDTCDHCKFRDGCTTVEMGNGRTISISENEQLQHRLSKQIKTPSGRRKLRQRTHVEHKLAHIASRQGDRARYIGIRKNIFDLRRAASIQNIEKWHRNEIAKAA